MPDEPMVGEMLVARPRRLTHGPPFPAAFRHVQIALPSAAGVDAHAVAVDLSEDDDPGLLASTVRRHWWSADHGQLPVRVASPRELDDSGERYLEVHRLELIDPAVLSLPGCPLSPVSPDRPHGWVPATVHRLGGEISTGWVPYSLAFPRAHDTRPDEPLTHPPFLAGIGGGEGAEGSLDDAWASLCAEDGLQTWWVGLARPRPWTPATETTRLLADADLEFQWRLLPTPLGGTAILAAVDDGSVVTLGAAHGPAPDAERLAVARALWQLALARALDRPEDTLHAMGVAGLAPHRPDRHYVPRTLAARRRLQDPLAHLQLALDPAMRSRVREHLDDVDAHAPAGAPEVASPLSRLPQGDAWCVSLGPPESPGLAVRLLVPGAATLPLGAFPPDPELLGQARRRQGKPRRRAASPLSRLVTRTTA